MDIQYIEIENNQRISLNEIPKIHYSDFFEIISEDLMLRENAHCVNYFAHEIEEGFRLFCIVAIDSTHQILLLSTVIGKNQVLDSFTCRHFAFHVFERELHENFGIQFTDHPWLKPVRYPWSRADKNQLIENYPFYSIPGDELHEVGVGPIHAGIIEPGHFRFICNGEQIMHLEIQLGYQHRGIEQLFFEKKSLLQRATLSENIAGDSVVGHGTAFAHAWESICGFAPSEKLQAERLIAAELERMAIHTGDLSAICTDIAYQLGSSVFGRLRTPLINFFQQWCGNRLAKSLIRPGKSNFALDDELVHTLKSVFKEYKPHFIEMASMMFDLPSVLSRLERTGVVSTQTAHEIGVVGMAARASNLPRDIRLSHPYGYYKKINSEPVLLSSGDVYARARLRYLEILKSMETIEALLDKLNILNSEKAVIGRPMPHSFVVSITEGWRGEICHCALTDKQGDIVQYKIKDPSLHNWMALALAVRKNEISDFPVCNKSFNLSYCGHDL